MRAAAALALLASVLLAGCVIEARPPGFVAPHLEGPQDVAAEREGAPTDVVWVVLAEGSLVGRAESGDAWPGIKVGCGKPETYREHNGTLHLDAPGLDETTHVVYGVNVTLEDPGYAGTCRTGGVRYYGQDAPGERRYQLPRGIPYALTFEEGRVLVLEDGTRIPEGGEGTLPLAFERTVQDSEGGLHRITYTGSLLFRNLGLVEKSDLEVKDGERASPADQAAVPADPDAPPESVENETQPAPPPHGDPAAPAEPSPPAAPEGKEPEKAPPQEPAPDEGSGDGDDAGGEAAGGEASDTPPQGPDSNP